MPDQSIKNIIEQYRVQIGGNRFAYGIGCASLGRNMEDQQKVKEDLSALMTAYDQGFRYFDTSRAYGESEVIVGAFVKEVPRDRICIATKTRVPYTDHPKQAASALEENLKQSLVRLNTDHIDLFQIHDVDTLSHIVVENGALEVLIKAKKEGLIRHFGLATRDHRLLEEAVGHGQFDSILTYSDYTPINQSAEAVIRLANARRVGVINGSPLCFGWLSGANPRERQAGSHPQDIARKEGSTVFYDYCQARHVPVLAAALQYPLRNGGIDITLTGPASPSEAMASSNALGEPISDEFWTEWNVTLKDNRLGSGDVY